MQRKLVALLIGLLAGVVWSAPTQAARITFFTSPRGDGAASAGIPSLLAPGRNDLDLFADPTAAPGGGVFGVATVLIETFGAVSITGFDCTAVDCLFVSPSSTQVLFSGGDVVDGEFEVFRVGDISLQVDGAGGLRLTSGSTLSADFSDTRIDGPQLIARTSAVPEPTSAALLMFAVLCGVLARNHRGRADASRTLAQRS